MSEPAKPSTRGRRRWVGAAAALGVAVAAALLWPGLWRGTPQEQTGVSPDLPKSGLAWFPAGKREAAPKLAGPTLEGPRLALADLRGNVVVVNVWGSWCAPCREEAPDLARVARETKTKGVRFLGIDTRDNKAAARAFVRNLDIGYPSLFDPDGKLMLAFNGVVPLSAVPSTIVVDPDGRIAARVVGKVTYSTLRGLVEDVLSEDATAAAGDATRGGET